jgi:hypothetical protein
MGNDVTPTPSTASRRRREVLVQRDPGRLSGQRLAYHSSPLFSQANPTVLIIEQKSPVLDSVLQGCTRRSAAENHPPLHRPPIGELVEFPAQVTGCLIGRSTLVHALSLKTAPSSEHRLS